MPTNARNDFQSLMAGEPIGRLLLYINATPPILDLIEERTGTRSPEDAFDLDFVHVGAGAHGDPDAWRSAVEDQGATVPDDGDFDGLGGALVRHPAETLGAGYHFREKFYALAQITAIEQLQALPWPDVNDPRHYAHLPDRVAAARQSGRAVVGGKECTLFEAAWYRRGMDNLFFDLVEGNGVSDWLLDWFTEHSIAACRAYVKAGVDAIGLGDDIGTQRGMMMAPDFWREHIKPRLKRVIDAIRDAQTDRHVHVRYHSDGDVRAVLDDLSDIGVDILNPVQPECMPPEEVIPAYQDRLAFWGMIGTQTTMPFGSPDDVRQAVAQCAALARHGARLIIAPTHVLEPEVPWANITALVEAVREAQL